MDMNSNQTLIQQLLDCAITCEACATACLNEENVTGMRQCIRLDRDCADICTLAARLLQRDSAIARQYLLLCEEICRMCAEECGRHDHDHCRRCAEACTNCANACHENHESILQS